MFYRQVPLSPVIIVSDYPLKLFLPHRKKVSYPWLHMYTYIVESICFVNFIQNT
jgi:hypothetical protein